MLGCRQVDNPSIMFNFLRSTLEMRNRYLIILLFISILLTHSQRVCCQSSYISISDITQKSDSLFKVGEIKSSASFAEVALYMLSCINDTTSVTYAKTLHSLANAHFKLANFEKSISLSEKSVSLYESDYKTDPNYPSALLTLAGAITETNDYMDAPPIYCKAINIIESTIGNDNLTYVNAILEYSYNLLFVGDFVKARQLCDNAIEICNRNGFDSTIEYARAYSYLASSLAELGDYDAAIFNNAKAIEIFSECCDEQHPEYAYILNQQAYFYSSYADFVSALPFMLKATEVRKNAYGIEHYEYIHSISNLAVIYECIGDYSLALDYALQSLYLGEISNGKNNYNYAGALQALSGIYIDLKEYDKAIQSSLDALSILKSIYGPQHYVYADALVDVATTYKDAKVYDKAISYANDAVSVLSTQSNPNEEDVASAYQLLSDVYSAVGKYQDALNYAEKSLEIRLKLFGNTSKKYLNSLFPIIDIKRKMGIIDARSVNEYNKVKSDIVKYAFANLTSHRRKLVWDLHNDWFLEYLPQYLNQFKCDSLNSVLYDATLMSKGVLLSTDQELSTIVSRSNDNKLNDLYEDYRSTSVMLNTLENSRKDDHYLDIDSLSYRKEYLEKEMMSLSKGFGDFTRNLEIKWNDVQEKLDQNSIAIEFIEYTNEKNEIAYCALTVKPNYSFPHLIHICTKKEINKLSPELYYTSLDLSDLIFSKLEEELHGITNVYFAPSGILYSIAVESLPYKSENQRFGDKFKTFRLSSTRELLRVKNDSKIWTSSVVYGGIKYDDLAAVNSESDSLRSGFSYLPATLDEAKSITRMLETDNRLVKLYTGYDATEMSVKSISGIPISHLHIATHGFYIKDNEIPLYAKSFPTLALNGFTDVAESSMQRSGLLFSGANISLSDNIDNDGILTSAEISNLDLNNIKLVVLSACQTGLGEISTEGVWGLQRGFKKAGAGAIIMSLWKVNDYSTRIMMEEFYRRINAGKSIVNSFNAAINKVRKFRGKIDIDGHKARVNFSAPQYWAPFILLDCVE